jgi:hypothetical protein
MAIPVFVIVRDRYEQLLKTVASIEGADNVDIVLVDNSSTYEPTVEYLRSSPHRVIYTGTNHGHHSPWTQEIVPRFSPFGVTDPDIEINPDCPTDWAQRMLDFLMRHPDHLKCGFGLRIDDIPEQYFLRDQVLDHEGQFWAPILETWDNGTPVYDVALDTTLAIYPRNVGWDIWPAARTGFPYVARHLAWYVDSGNLTDDEIYYRSHCDRGVASWKYSEEL